MKRGDIFHDGLLGYWIIHEKPKGKKLFCVPLEKLFEKKEKHGGCCDFFHELAGWNFKDVKVVCNLYKEPAKAKKIVEAYEEQLCIANISISLPDYEYEMLIDDEGTPFEINSWIPIATDRIKDTSRINEYIEKGLIRKRQ